MGGLLNSFDLPPFLRGQWQPRLRSAPSPTAPIAASATTPVLDLSMLNPSNGTVNAPQRDVPKPSARQPFQPRPHANAVRRAPSRAGPPPLPEGVDWDFVRQHEGDGTSAYVPRRDGTFDQNSGITVAHGVDLGGQTPEHMTRMGLPENLVRTLTPYTGLHGAEGARYVRDHPLRISAEQQAVLDAYVFNDTYRGIADQFDRAARNGTSFGDLPREAQTVVVDLAHQYGPGAPTQAPNFWQQVTQGQWEDAYRNLQNFGDAFGPRRRDEGALLRRGLDAGTLPRAATRNQVRPNVRR
jgi:Bacterial toxin homologue of phage lysozyme, C-term